MSTIADISGILSFVMSIVLFGISHSILKDATEKRKDYNAERINIQTDLIALRDNIWEDRIDNIKIRSQLRQALYSYRNRYWFIAFPFRLFHIERSLRLIKGSVIPENKKETLCNHLDYLIGTMDRKEIINNEK